MALPVINTPTFKVTVPSTQQEIEMRPFLVKEQKILLMAKEGEDPKEIADATQKLLENCVLTEDFNVKALASFDIEYLFLKLRAKSVSEVTNVMLNHKGSDCNHSQAVSIELDNVEVQFSEDHTDTINVSGDIGVVMKYPTLAEVSESDAEDPLDIVTKSIKYVYDSENVYDNFSEKEINDFVDSLTKQQFEQVVSFFETIPTLRKEVTWTCDKCKETETVTLEGLTAFF